MIDFYEYNINPKGRKTGDCSVRALATLLGISWEDALRYRYEESLNSGYFVNNREVTDAILTRCGYIKQKEPKKICSNGRKRRYTVKELEKLLTAKQLEEGVYVSINGHDTVIKNSKIIDLWNCGDEYVRNYWVK